jgi:hypothetical protein
MDMNVLFSFIAGAATSAVVFFFVWRNNKAYFEKLAVQFDLEVAKIAGTIDPTALAIIKKFIEDLKKK